MSLLISFESHTYGLNITDFCLLTLSMYSFIFVIWNYPIKNKQKRLK